MSAAKATENLAQLLTGVNVYRTDRDRWGRSWQASWPGCNVGPVLAWTYRGAVTKGLKAYTKWSKARG